MSQELQQYFLQSVTINGNKVPREWIFTSVYVEKANLRAPLLKLEIHDITGTIIDDWKTKYGAALVAEMGDPQGNSGTFKRGARRIRKKSYAKVFRASVRAETSRL
ncbi:hypothetical protein QS100_19890, partial [Escherichia coli]|nr:hypothetical protein [Escherichia coli]